MRTPSQRPSNVKAPPRRLDAGRPNKKLSQGRFAAMLLTPTGVILLALVLVPILFLIVTSFTDFNQASLFTGTFKFKGFAQYVVALKDIEFWKALLRTFIFTAALVIGSLLIGMAVAQMMTKLGTVMRYIVTFVLIFAWAMPNVASSVVWKWLFQPGYGIVNWMLTKLHVFGNMLNVAWSNNTTLAFLCIWMLVIWQAVPYIAITLYAATTQLDQSCLEAAQIDGAGHIRTYWQIVVPLIKPSIMVIAMLSIIWDFNVFNQIWLVSQGGPNGTTSTIGVFTYKKAFVNFDIAQGAAISVITVIILMALTGVYVRNLLKSGEDL
ncbi:N,N'-diacetylchitobiose transport system permease protein [Bifidobacterium bohemicum]|uniref:ABC transporter, permease protein n=1 Tax=Bifidobacterium bohemicum DSM 22767 TaxID=1437606 RepID=A0A086ZKA9_9BIFI|nr:sugar ABC transporter permease [Bifidobacterium bohemicum]KFI46959.1 ABC transporter, permease protein [Bifidobacterium bohemicum DSM 22767]SCB86228.1 N,N'-diacetylchitobiose transport system permease protein [Bifidobacterium bohemicum]